MFESKSPDRDRPDALGTYDWAKFAQFLARAEEYDRTGVLLVAAPTTRTKAASKAPKPAAVEVIRKITSLDHNILNPALTTEAIDADLALLDGLKKKAELLEIANVVGIVEKIKKLKLAGLSPAIKQAIRDRRGDVSAAGRHHQTLRITSVVDGATSTAMTRLGSGARARRAAMAS